MVILGKGLHPLILLEIILATLSVFQRRREKGKYVQSDEDNLNRDMNTQFLLIRIT